MRVFHLFGKPRQRKHIGVHKNHLIYIQEQARIHHIMVETATHTLLREGLLVETNIDIDHYQSPQDVTAALRQRKSPVESTNLLQASIILHRKDRAIVWVNSQMHAALTEYAKQRHLTLVETVIVLLQKAVVQDFRRDPRTSDLTIPLVHSRDDLAKILQ